MGILESEFKGPGVTFSFAFLLKPSNPTGAKRKGVINTEIPEISTVLEMLN